MRTNYKVSAEMAAYYTDDKSAVEYYAGMACIMFAHSYHINAAMYYCTFEPGDILQNAFTICAVAAQPDEILFYPGNADIKRVITRLHELNAHIKLSTEVRAGLYGAWYIKIIAV